MFFQKLMEAKIPQYLNRSSHRRCSVKNVLLKISQISQESTCVGVSVMNNRLQQRCFPVKLANFFKSTCFEERLLTKLPRFSFGKIMIS